MQHLVVGSKVTFPYLPGKGWDEICQLPEIVAKVWLWLVIRSVNISRDTAIVVGSNKLSPADIAVTNKNGEYFLLKKYY